MGSNNDLKQRFLKLQSKEQFVSETVIEKKPTPIATGDKLELSKSTQSHVHEAIENSSQTQVYDWKKTYRKSFHRPTLEETCEPIIQKTQWNIHSLVDNSPLISFHYTHCLSKTLTKLNTYLEAKPFFWSHLMSGAGQIHIRSTKNKLQLWIRSNDSSELKQKRLKTVLENEFIANSKQLKAFSVQKVEEWFELSLDITEKTVDIRDKEASV
ncbi:MAG: hypothetical protein H0V66_00060 [Bdellovibrionales bacterium]|nr:hypothetical protein [Bdellovibrionales bacterium]